VGPKAFGLSGEPQDENDEAEYENHRKKQPDDQYERGCDDIQPGFAREPGPKIGKPLVGLGFTGASWHFVSLPPSKAHLSLCRLIYVIQPGGNVFIPHRPGMRPGAAGNNE
jgi:hypothetical protein